MLPDISTLAKLLQNADSPRSHNYTPPTPEGITNKDVYGPGHEGNVLPHGALPGGRFPSALARLLRQMKANRPHLTQEGDYHG